jgi:uncharacterized repeat protein (TIGR01451 family)
MIRPPMIRAPMIRAPRIRAIGAALLAAAAAAQAPIVNTVVNNGSTVSHYDLVFLGDGYQAAQQTQFDQDVLTCVTSMFQHVPYSTFASYFNVHTVFRASQDAGASQPDVQPPIVRNTAYGASYNTGGTARCLYITNTSLALQDAALAPATEGRVIVLVNDSRYGGCAAQFAVSYNGSLMPEVQTHEIGHALGGLADEYDYPNGTYTGGEPGQANITANSAAGKWSQWFGTDNIGAFEGAGYYLNGLFRPRLDCLMRNLGVTLCSVCREQLARAISAVANPIDGPIPTATSFVMQVPSQQSFSFTNLVPPANNPRVEWAVDGSVVPGATTSSFLFDSSTVALGVHTVRATVYDQTTLVRVDPSHAMQHSRTWSVSVSDPNAADLTVVSTVPSPVFVAPSDTVTFTTTVANAGPHAATNIDVELFLSTDSTLQTTDVYLGSATIPSIAAGQQAVETRTLQIPALLDQRYYYLIAVADRLNTVFESNYTNNTRLSVLIVQNPFHCAPQLELRDDMQWPRDQGTIRVAAGGTLSPTVVAHCAAPGTLYLIVWGASGTSPGTTVAPGITVPINQDPVTELGLGATNGAVLQQFFGTLDAGGVGHATLQWPAGIAMLPMASNFAAVLLDANGFVGATNAIAVTFTP